MQTPQNRILTFPIRLAVVVLLYGLLFKIMHWPYAQQLILIGSFAITILYLLRFIYKTEKIRLDYVKLGLVVLWTFIYSVKTFHILQIPYVLELLLLLLFAWWFIEEGLTYFTRRRLIDNGFIKFFYYGFSITAVAMIIIGALFKIQHWPYGALILTLGCLLLSFMLIVDYFVIKRS